MRNAVSPRVRKRLAQAELRPPTSVHLDSSNPQILNRPSPSLPTTQRFEPLPYKLCCADPRPLDRCRTPLCGAHNRQDEAYRVGNERLVLSNNHAYTGSEGEPEDGPAVAASLWIAVFVYLGFFVFCGFQAYLHLRGSRGGAISLQ
ncbi:hypothetical protein N7468_003411 [Penicillium chermesinum]|uniref:Uncharacterized protein n=1 Tax=Penicillium chermesinum TaxID=63820 RepID=A0A9W9TRS6_9EURO|nr:uncharacterized protein N7468_003411 [Penicillium chermesinum]KAJ5238792.1 hypothetical protein N7468_003411 [Penicillium chermesinum]KAJ6164432.1 hypothetical protein N7470_003104 [Penicillium chermesinum]